MYDLAELAQYSFAHFVIDLAKVFTNPWILWILPNIGVVEKEIREKQILNATTTTPATLLGTKMRFWSTRMLFKTPAANAKFFDCPRPVYRRKPIKSYSSSGKRESIGSPLFRTSTDCTHTTATTVHSMHSVVFVWYLVAAKRGKFVSSKPNGIINFDDNSYAASVFCSKWNAKHLAHRSPLEWVQTENHSPHTGA